MKTVAQTFIEADRYYIIAAHTGNVMQAVEPAKEGGTVRLGKYNHKPEQEWSFIRVGEGMYRIRNRASGKLLDLMMTGTSNGTWLHLWEDVGGTSQVWGVRANPDGTVRLISNWAGGRCVDTVGMGAEVGAVLQIWAEVSDGADQRWTITEVKDRAKRAAKKVEDTASVEEKTSTDTAAQPAAQPAEKKQEAGEPCAKKPAAAAQETPEEKGAAEHAPVKKTVRKSPAKKTAPAKAEQVPEKAVEPAAEKAPAKRKSTTRKKTTKE